MDSSKVTAVLILYETTEEVLKCLESLKDIKFIIVDNGKNDKSIINQIKNYKNLSEYIVPKKNLGFGKACNQAFNLVKTEFTLFIEPDVTMSIKDIYSLIKTLEENPNAAFSVPLLIDNNKKIIDKLENLPEFYSNSENEKINEINQNLYNALPEGDMCVNFSWAAVFMTNNKVIKKHGLFDEKYFIYWEDFDLCRKYRFLKIPVIKSFDSRAEHKIAGSTKKNIKNYFILQKHHILSSYIYFKVNKKSFFIYKRFFTFLFRSLSNLFIFNFKKSIKNFARATAVITYIIS